jgi:hypothetical protein
MRRIPALPILIPFGGSRALSGYSEWRQAIDQSPRRPGAH